MKKALTYFIVFDLFVAGFMIADSSYKSNHNGQSMIGKFWHVINKPASDVTPSVVALPSILNPVKKSSICVNYGPLGIQDKAAMNVILNQGKVDKSQYMASQSQLYEVYWNLGSDKLKAIEMFEAQKNDGPLQDEKFKIRQEQAGNWVVPVSVVAGDTKLAQKMVNDLSQSAKNIGGKWEYKEKGVGYFYQFKDINSLPPKTLGVMNQTINVLKTPC